MSNVKCHKHTKFNNYFWIG